MTMLTPGRFIRAMKKTPVLLDALNERWAGDATELLLDWDVEAGAPGVKTR